MSAKPKEKNAVRTSIRKPTWAETRQKLLAAFFAFLAIAFTLFYGNNAVEIIREAQDVLLGVYTYCGLEMTPSCITFLPERWIQGIASGLAALGLLFAFAQAAGSAWSRRAKRYALEFDRKAVYALSMAMLGLAISGIMEAYKWFRLFWFHENALFHIGLTAIELILLRKLWNEVNKMSDGEALSLEWHRHTQ
ncbi:hypothetical protein KJ765_02785 [Candidatus Micrarchaeota archaeon]|nr:hypothetical protein [Candidatus Micrarchaeota archaeon]